MKKDKIIFSAIIAGLCLVLLFLVLDKFVILRPKVRVQRLRNGDFRLLTLGKPFFIQGVVYNPVPIGQNHQYNFWADPAKPWIIDGRMMREMGVNTVRFFQSGPDIQQSKKVIRELYQGYGIRTVLGHWMDYWTPGNYADPRYRRDLSERVLEMVRAYKDEEGILFWILGNENNLSWHTGARVPWSCQEADQETDPYQKELIKAKIYYSLVNDIAEEIKKIDPHHPVALGNADSYTLEIAKQVCPDIDLVALTAYRGKSFGNLWREIKRKIDKPILIMEFGCDSFNAQTGAEDQEVQAAFLKSQWQDIKRNSAGGTNEGNALGGCVFEWNDEWWKHNEQLVSSWHDHNTEGAWSCGGYYFDIAAPGNLNINEEWWGLVALSPELEKGINKRIKRQAYYELQALWKEDKK